MKTFLQWAEENGYKDLVVTDGEKPEKAKSENRVRTGLTANYPDAYLRAQYPDLWYTPHKATAVLDLKQKPNKQYAGQKAAN